MVHVTSYKSTENNKNVVSYLKTTCKKSLEVDDMGAVLLTQLALLLPYCEIIKDANYLD